MTEATTKRVYFIQAGENGPIKIGIAKHPGRRLIALQSARNESLRLLAHMPGDMATEWSLHMKFAAHRIKGEWFAPSDEIMAEVAVALTFDQSLGPTKDQWKPDPTRVAFLASFERLIAETFPVVLEAAFGPAPSATRDIAAAAGVSTRCAANWRKANGLIPQAACLMALGKANPMIGVWIMTLLAAAHIAEVLEIDVKQAHQMALGDWSLVREAWAA